MEGGSQQLTSVSGVAGQQVGRGRGSRAGGPLDARAEAITGEVERGRAAAPEERLGNRLYSLRISPAVQLRLQNRRTDPRHRCRGEGSLDLGGIVSEVPPTERRSGMYGEYGYLRRGAFSAIVGDPGDGLITHCTERIQSTRLGDQARTTQTQHQREAGIIVDRAQELGFVSRKYHAPRIEERQALRQRRSE